MSPLAADFSTDVVSLITGIAWPVVIGVVVWRLLPTIKRVLASRGFTINAGGMEISVQQASENLTERLEDLREQVSALKAQVDAAGPPASGEEQTAVSPISEGLPGLSAVIWVDDYPENNAFEVDTLRRKGVRVFQARTTLEAMRLLDSRPDTSAIITDMGRTENGYSKDTAGIELISQVRESQPQLPVLVYASAPAVGRTRALALEAGATFVTSSATELLEELGRAGMR